VTTTNPLERLEAVERTLLEARTPREVKTSLAILDVLGALAKELGLTRDEQNRIAEGRLRAMRRGGQLIPESGIGKGIKSVTLTDFNLDENESRRWQTVAQIPDSIFERYIADVMEDEAGEITVAGLLRRWSPKAVPTAGSREAPAMPFLRFSQVDLPTATIVTLILRVLFPDARTALDTTYGNGAFWDGSAHVEVTAHDANPARAPGGVEDFTKLTYADDSFDVVLFDPPHVADAGADSVMGQRYGTYSGDQLQQAIVAGTGEAWRVGKLGIVVKVTDHVHGQRYVEESDWVRMALEDQTPYEVVHQVRSGALIDPKWEEQLSAYNNGSTYLIFRKGRQEHVRR
jgi:hypothetical protein